MSNCANKANNPMSVVCLLIVAIMISSVIIPLVALTGIAGFAGVFSSMLFHGIGSGDGPADLRAQKARLKEISAYEGEARGSAKALQVIVVDYDGDAGLRTPDNASAASPRKAMSASVPAGYREIELNTASANSTAVLVIYGDPIFWRLRPGPEQRRARLAFEGSPPMDATGGYPGLLAGYRIAAFGDRAAARPGDYLNGTAAKNFCDSLKTWRRFFGVGHRNVWVTVISNATTITVGDANVYHNGRAVTGAPPINLFCRSW